MKIRTTLIIWAWLVVAFAGLAAATAACLAFSWLIQWNALVGGPVTVVLGSGLFALVLAHLDWSDDS